MKLTETSGDYLYRILYKSVKKYGNYRYKFFYALLSLILFSVKKLYAELNIKQSCFSHVTFADYSTLTTVLMSL